MLCIPEVVPNAPKGWVASVTRTTMPVPVSRLMLSRRCGCRAMDPNVSTRCASPRRAPPGWIHAGLWLGSNLRGSRQKRRALIEASTNNLVINIAHDHHLIYCSLIDSLRASQRLASVAV